MCGFMDMGSHARWGSCGDATSVGMLVEPDERIHGRAVALRGALNTLSALVPGNVQYAACTKKKSWIEDSITPIYILCRYTV